LLGVTERESPIGAGPTPTGNIIAKSGGYGIMKSSGKLPTTGKGGGPRALLMRITGWSLT